MMTKVVVDLLLLFGGYAMVFLVSPKRNASAAAPGSLARSPGGSHSQVFGEKLCKTGGLFLHAAMASADGVTNGTVFVGIL